MPDALAHVPKNARAPRTRLTTHWPPPEGNRNPAPGSPKATTHAQTRSARHVRTPEGVREPEGSACATVPQSGVPRHTRARNATPIRPHGCKQPRGEDPVLVAEAAIPERADCQ